MGAENAPTWMARHYRVAERDRTAAQAERVLPRRVGRRVVVDGAKRYVAYDAHSLLEGEWDQGRPGHLR